ncbi:expressed unknown protein [Seminavis robusta]|uniref:TLC domain-containing protein n=1 Tax=Seminavis robusta TaxID=568900 RepID=A0A9N8HC23_9STRA|nr:expressed unknown protein [Seminavis robusta]|eukprot:Sro301_g112020.1 n/a (220) ;mRNA; f:56446-57105
MASITEAWEVLNSDDSFLPFYLPLAFWTGAFLVSKVRKIEFHDWKPLHNAFNMAAIALSAISLYFGNDNIFNERIPILFSLSYFSVDLVDCVWRRDIAFTFHAVFCLILGTFNYATPVLRTIRANSKACMFELSSPFLHRAKRTRQPTDFLLFVVVFTCCRIIWIPLIGKQMHEAGLIFPTDIRQILVVGFYALNLFWYYKMIRIVLDAVTQSKQEKSV